MNYKRGLLVCLVAVFLLVPLSAKEISITWEWEQADEQVTEFRYQLNDQDPDGWIIVDSSVTSYTIGPVQDSQEYTLYLQQSYDGSSWSESGLLVYDPREFGINLETETPTELAEVPKESVPVVTEAAVTEPTVEPALPVEEPGLPVVTEIAFEQPVVEPVPVAQPVSVPAAPEILLQRIELYAGAGGKADNFFPTGSFDPSGSFMNLRTRILPSITLDYVRSALMGFGETIDLGIRAGVGYSGYASATTAIVGFDLHALALAELDPTGPLAFEAALGLAFMFTGSAIQSGASTDIGVFFGPVAQIGMSYRITDTWFAGVQAETRFLLANQFDPYELTGMVRLGAGYRF